jgi:hypothetical protein
MVAMTLEDLADLIRADSANINRRMEELHAETCGHSPACRTMWRMSAAR